LCDSINPDGYSYACFARAVAQDMRHESPHPYQARDFSMTPDHDLPSPPEHMEAVMKSVYGDREFSTLERWQNEAQQMGLAVPMTFEQMTHNLAQAGNGARAVFWMQRQNFGGPGGAGLSHVANIAYQDGIHITDTIDLHGAATGFYDEVLSHVHDRGSLSLFWMYRTAGPDRVK
jgi:hypothetical protein